MNPYTYATRPHMFMRPQDQHTVYAYRAGMDGSMSSHNKYHEGLYFKPTYSPAVMPHYPGIPQSAESFLPGAAVVQHKAEEDDDFEYTNGAVHEFREDSNVMRRAPGASPYGRANQHAVSMRATMANHMVWDSGIDEQRREMSLRSLL
jgi:hypothetical protein